MGTLVDDLSNDLVDPLSLGQKLWQINWGLIFLLLCLVGIGAAMLYSAANGSFEPWATRHIMRFGIAFAIMLAVALIDIRRWYSLCYLAYFAVLAMLVGVEFFGQVGMGAQRWIDLKVIQLQPSELMKVALVMALARYFHGRSLEEVRGFTRLLPPLALILLPVGLVLKQPDLGTALTLLAIGGVMFFVVGVRLWKFALVIAGGLAAIPIGWQFLHDYQQKRVLTFLNPENDPLGAGYHITQSKIALGSGGVFGKGFMQGSQSHLNFLPEKQTDFIFTMLAEEFGMVGGLFLLLIYAGIIVYGFAIALRSRNHFGRVLAMGVSANLFFYVFINTAMVMGLIPVVGVPLPMISYGGTAMVAVMGSIGLLLSVYVHRDIRIPRQGPGASD
ncbi:MAG: rod shape-determining protein RodA [Limibacillus sp.]